MALSITDPAIRAQLEADIRAGRVPVWNPNNQTQAQAFINYFNTLTNSTAMRLVTKTTYAFEIINPGG